MLQAQVVGNIGWVDSEVKENKGKVSLVFTVAHNYATKKQDGSGYDSHVIWVRCILMGEKEYLLKKREDLKPGAIIFVQGNLSVEVYQPKADSTGSTTGPQASTTIFVDKFEFQRIKSADADILQD